MCSIWVEHGPSGGNLGYAQLAPSVLAYMGPTGTSPQIITWTSPDWSHMGDIWAIWGKPGTCTAWPDRG